MSPVVFAGSVGRSWMATKKTEGKRHGLVQEKHRHHRRRLRRAGSRSGIPLRGLGGRGASAAARRDKATESRGRGRGIATCIPTRWSSSGRDDLDAVAIIDPAGRAPSSFRSPRSPPASTSSARSRSLSTRKQAAAMRDAAEAAAGRRWSATNSGTRRSAPTSGSLLREGYIGKFQLCTIELFLDRYVTQSRARSPGMRTRRKAADCWARSARTTSMVCATGLARSHRSTGRLAALRPDVARRGDQPGRQSRTDDTFSFMLSSRTAASRR